jgi:spermidine/putrescine transport system ATP-binding protein
MSTVIKNEDSLMNNLPNDEYPSDEVSRSSPDRFVDGGSVGTGVSLRQVTKQFGDVVAVNSVTLDIDQNEFFSILGPSGCGKTTLMRMIAGFERPSSGSIALLGEPVERLPPSQRNLNMVFQNYALFPHLSVYENVAFELKVRRFNRGEIAQKVSDALALVQMAEFGKRKPAQLSGGQRQRIALARALVGRPAVLLLDEPLGALDQKLRKEMQIELKRLQREVGITFIYVTHDQEEALTMSDRIAVMRGGSVLQVDFPRALYERPTSRYVASFIGQSNFLKGTVIESGTDYALVDTGVTGKIRTRPESMAKTGSEVTIAIRPERLRLVTGAERSGSENLISGSLREVLYVGNDTHFIVDLANGAEITVREQNSGSIASSELRQGDQVAVNWPSDGALILLT